VGRIVNYTINREVAASSTETVTVLYPAPGRKAKLVGMQIHVPTGTDFALKVRLWRGDEPLFEGDKYISTAQGTVKLNLNEENVTYGSLTVEIVNTDSANPHKIMIVLEFA